MLEFPTPQMLWGQAGGLGISRVNDSDTLVSKKKKCKTAVVYIWVWVCWTLIWVQEFFLKLLYNQSYISYLQVMEKLVDIVHYLHLEIHEAFGSAGMHGKLG
jgi:hypothetical protein